jgi:hypothetical protein
MCLIIYPSKDFFIKKLTDYNFNNKIDSKIIEYNYTAKQASKDLTN